MLDEFRRIAETAMPQQIDSRIVTPDEARAVISSFNRLTDGPLRTNFLRLPVDNIVEFSMMQTKKHPSLHSYMNGVQEQINEPILEQAVEPELIAEAPEPTKPEPQPQENFFQRLTERLELLTQPVIVETTEKHVERLVETEQALLLSIRMLTEQVEKISTNADDARIGLSETLTMQRSMMANLSESQAQITAAQSIIVESQRQIVETMGALVAKIEKFSQTPPVVNPIVNVPAPIVNITTMEGRRTKIVERDENNLIARIVEGFEEG